MDFVVTILASIFIGLLLMVALSFSFVLLAWFVAVALAATAFMLVKQWYYRWRFLHDAKVRPPRVIDAEYKDITKP
jgi:hypothetical protein